MRHHCVTTMLLLVLFLNINSFIWCSRALYAHNYYDDMTESCRESSSCSGKTSAIFSISRNCQCDAQCANYGDCCQDSPHFRPSALLDCVKVGDWNTAEDYTGSYYMVTSCPSSWVGEQTRYRCEKYKETIRREPILGHPVTSRATNITYSNYHCARCNSDLHISTLIRWKLAVACDSKLSLPVPDIDTVIKEATYGEDFKLKPKFANASYHTCRLYVWRPLNLLRRCHQRVVVTCPPSWQNETVRTQCEAYTSLIFKLRNRPYRNPHCATCNEVPNKSMECVKKELEIERTFPILFDFSDNSNDEVGKTRICPSLNEAYDPVAKICRHIILSIAEQEGDYMSDNCYGNISACKALNCSRFVLGPEEYLLNDNFTVTDLLSNKLYSSGEFTIKDNRRIEVCAQYQVTEEKFNSTIRYITILGLGISMGFLILHLLAFATNAVHRNLSGKNLASLCTALILAYGNFIVGQLLQVGGTACKVVAVVTYYSFLSSFSWLLVMAIDVWRTLRMSTLHLRVVSRESRWCVFITYSALCWFIFPGILVSTALGMELLQVESAFWPGFGVHNCWFGKRKALAVLFAIPVGVVMAFNLAFFVSSAHMICATAVALSNQSSSTHRDYKLFARLALLMGLTWLMGFIADYWNSEAVWYIFVALNAFQGFFIFIAFTWTKKVRNQFRTHVYRDSKSKSMEKGVICWSWKSSRTVHTESTD